MFYLVKTSRISFQIYDIYIENIVENIVEMLLSTIFCH